MSDIKKNLIFIFPPPQLVRYQWVGSVWPIRTRWQSQKYTNTGGGDYCSYPLSDLVSANRCLRGCGGRDQGHSVFMVGFHNCFSEGVVWLYIIRTGSWLTPANKKQTEPIFVGRSRDPLCQVWFFMMMKTIRTSLIRTFILLKTHSLWRNYIGYKDINIKLLYTMV